MKLKDLKHALYGVIKWGTRTNGKYLSSFEVVGKLKELGFPEIDPKIMGMYLSKDKYYKQPRFEDSDPLSGNFYPKKTNTFLVEFLNISPELLTEKVKFVNTVANQAPQVQEKEDYDKNGLINLISAVECNSFSIFKKGAHILILLNE